MTGGMQVRGVDRLVDTLHAAGDQLEDLEQADRRAGSLVASVVRRLTPRLTGALAASVDVVVTNAMVQVTAGNDRVDYAPPVHRRNPWMAKAAQRTESDVIRIYTEAAADAVDQIKGV